MKMKEKDILFWFSVYSLFGVWKIVQTLAVILFQIFHFFHFRKTNPQCLAEMCNVVRETSTKDRKTVQSLIALCKQVQECFQVFEVLPTCSVLASKISLSLSCKHTLSLFFACIFSRSLSYPLFLICTTALSLARALSFSL